MVMATSDSMLSATSGPDECQSLSTTCNCGECSWGTDQLKFEVAIGMDCDHDLV